MRLKSLVFLLVLLVPWTAPGHRPRMEGLRAYLPYPPAEREATIRRFLALKSSAHLLLGEEAARAVGRLLRLEIQNQAEGKRAAFKTPLEALEKAEAWLAAIGQALRKEPVNLQGLPAAPGYRCRKHRNLFPTSARYRAEAPVLRAYALPASRFIRDRPPQGRSYVPSTGV